MTGIGYAIMLADRQHLLLNPPSIPRHLCGEVASAGVQRYATHAGQEPRSHRELLQQGRDLRVSAGDGQLQRRRTIPGLLHEVDPAAGCAEEGQQRTGDPDLCQPASAMTAQGQSALGSQAVSVAM